MFVLLKNVMYTGLEWGGELLEIIEILCDYDVIVPWLRSLSLLDIETFIYFSYYYVLVKTGIRSRTIRKTVAFTSMVLIK